jgi:hypothetical protein
MCDIFTSCFGRISHTHSYYHAMMISLKENLYNLVRSRGYLSYGDMCQFVAEEGYKVSTAERRLRGLMARKNEQGKPQTLEIQAVMKKSKRNTDYIAAYRWIGAMVESAPTAGKIPSGAPYCLQNIAIAGATFSPKKLAAQKKEEGRLI